MDNSTLPIEDKTDQSSQLSTLDLYEDLLIKENQNNGDGNRILTMKEVLSEKQSLEEQNKLLLQQLVELKQKNQKFEEEKQNVEKNFKTLLATAKVELARKNRLLNHYIGVKEPQSRPKSSPKINASRRNDKTNPTKQKRLLALYKGRRADDPEPYPQKSHGLLQRRGEKMVGVATKVIGSSFENSSVASTSMISAQYSMTMNRRINQGNDMICESFQNVLTETSEIAESSIVNSNEGIGLRAPIQDSNRQRVNSISNESVNARPVGSLFYENPVVDIKDLDVNDGGGNNSGFQQRNSALAVHLPSSSHEIYSMDLYNTPTSKKNKHTAKIITNPKISKQCTEIPSSSRTTVSKGYNTEPGRSKPSPVKKDVSSKGVKMSPKVAKNKFVDTHLSPSKCIIRKNNERYSSKTRSPTVGTGAFKKLVTRSVRDFEYSKSPEKNICKETVLSAELESNHCANGGVQKSSPRNIFKKRDYANALSEEVVKNTAETGNEINDGKNTVKTSNCQALISPNKICSDVNIDQLVDNTDNTTVGSNGSSTGKNQIENMHASSARTRVKDQNVNEMRKSFLHKQSDGGPDYPELKDKSVRTEGKGIKKRKARWVSTVITTETKGSAEKSQNFKLTTKKQHDSAFEKCTNEKNIDISISSSSDTIEMDTNKKTIASPSSEGKRKKQAGKNVKISIQKSVLDPPEVFDLREKLEVTKSLKESNSDNINESTPIQPPGKTCIEVNGTSDLQRDERSSTNQEVCESQKSIDNISPRKQSLCPDFKLNEKPANDHHAEQNHMYLTPGTSEDDLVIAESQDFVSETFKNDKDISNFSAHQRRTENNILTSPTKISNGNDISNTNHKVTQSVVPETKADNERTGLLNNKESTNNNFSSLGHHTGIENDFDPQLELDYDENSLMNQDLMLSNDGHLKTNAMIATQKELDNENKDKQSLSVIQKSNCENVNLQSFSAICAVSIFSAIKKTDQNLGEVDENCQFSNSGETNQMEESLPSDATSLNGGGDNDNNSINFLNNDAVDAPVVATIQPDCISITSSTVAIRKLQPTVQLVDIRKDSSAFSDGTIHAVEYKPPRDCELVSGSISSLCSTGKDKADSPDVATKRRTSLDSYEGTPRKRRKSAEDRSKSRDFNLICCGKKINKDNATPKNQKSVKKVSSSSKNKSKDKKKKFNPPKDERSYDGKNIGLNDGLPVDEEYNLEDDVFNDTLCENVGYDKSLNSNEKSRTQGSVSSKSKKKKLPQKNKIPINDSNEENGNSADIRSKCISEKSDISCKTPTKDTIETDIANSPALSTRSRKKASVKSMQPKESTIEKHINKVKTRLEFVCDAETNKQHNADYAESNKTKKQNCENFEKMNNAEQWEVLTEIEEGEISDSQASVMSSQSKNTFTKILKNEEISDHGGQSLYTKDASTIAPSLAIEKNYHSRSGTHDNTNMIDIAMEVVVETTPNKENTEVSKKLKDKEKSKKKRKRKDKKTKLKVKLKQKKRRCEEKVLTSSAETSADKLQDSSFENDGFLHESPEKLLSVKVGFDSLSPSAELNRWLTSTKKNKKKQKKNLGSSKTISATDAISPSNCLTGVKPVIHKNIYQSIALPMENSEKPSNNTIEYTPIMPQDTDLALYSDSHTKEKSEALPNDSVTDATIQSTKHNILCDKRTTLETKCDSDEVHSIRSLGFTISDSNSHGKTETSSLDKGQSESVLSISSENRPFNLFKGQNVDSSFEPSVFPETNVSGNFKNVMLCYKNAALQWLIHMAKSRLNEINLLQPLDLSLKKLNKSNVQPIISKEKNPTVVTNLFSNESTCNNEIVKDTGKRKFSTNSALIDDKDSHHNSLISTSKNKLAPNSSSDNVLTSNVRELPKLTKRSPEKIQSTDVEDIPEILLHHNTDSIFDNSSFSSKSCLADNRNRVHHSSAIESRFPKEKDTRRHEHQDYQPRDSCRYGKTENNFNRRRTSDHNDNYVCENRERGRKNKNNVESDKLRQKYEQEHHESKYRENVSRYKSELHNFKYQGKSSNSHKHSDNKFREDRRMSPYERRRESKSSSNCERERCDDRNRSRRERSRTRSADTHRSRDHRESRNRNSQRRGSKDDDREKRQTCNYRDNKYHRYRDRQSPKRRKVDKEICAKKSRENHHKQQHEREVRGQSPTVDDWSLLLKEHVKYQKQSVTKNETESKKPSPAKKKKPRRVALERVEMPPKAQQSVDKRKAEDLVSPLSRYLWMNSLKDCQERRKKRARWSSEVSELELSTDDNAKLSDVVSIDQAKMSETSMEQAHKIQDSYTEDEGQCRRNLIQNINESAFSQIPQTSASKKLLHQTLLNNVAVENGSQSDSSNLSVAIPELSTSSWQLSEESRCRFYSFAKVIQVLSPLKSTPEKLFQPEKHSSHKKKVRRKVLQSP